MTAPTPDAGLIERLTEERDAAMLRLGTLGLSAEMPGDLAALCAKLGAMAMPSHKSWPTHYVNPDGREAAAAIEHLNTQLGEAAATLTAQAARIAELETALGPFAEPVEELDDIAEDLRAEDDMPVGDALFDYQQPTVGDIRRARAALRPVPGDGAIVGEGE